MSSATTAPGRSTGAHDDSLEVFDDLPAPEVIPREIVEDPTAALAEFEAVAAALEAQAGVRVTDRLRRSAASGTAGADRSPGA